MATEGGRKRWWGSFEFAEDGRAYWRIGPTEIWVERAAREWRVHRRTGADAMAPDLEVRAPAGEDWPEPAEDIVRYGFRETKPTLRLVPMVPDRPMVVNTEMAFTLPPHEETTLFVGTSVWVRLLAGAGPKILCEIPLFRPSDTWFGTTTREGELCYAGLTTARLDPANVGVVPHRAVSAVRVRNRSESSLSLGKLKRPMPNMSLFAAADGRLWTETVTLEHEQEGELTVLKLGKGPPSHAGGATAVSGPREVRTKGLLIRAFGGVLKGAVRYE